jgi:hypothetical protein
MEIGNKGYSRASSQLECGPFNEAWQDAMQRGKGWKKRGMEGQRTLLTKHPELS